MVEKRVDGGGGGGGGGGGLQPPRWLRLCASSDATVFFLGIDTPRPSRFDLTIATIREKNTNPVQYTKGKNFWRFRPNDFSRKQCARLTAFSSVAVLLPLLFFSSRPRYVLFWNQLALLAVAWTHFDAKISFGIKLQKKERRRITEAAPPTSSLVFMQRLSGASSQAAEDIADLLPKENQSKSDPHHQPIGHTDVRHSASVLHRCTPEFVPEGQQLIASRPYFRLPGCPLGSTTITSRRQTSLTWVSWRRAS